MTKQKKPDKYHIDTTRLVVNVGAEGADAIWHPDRQHSARRHTPRIGQPCGDIQDLFQHADVGWKLNVKWNDAPASIHTH